MSIDSDALPELLTLAEAAQLLRISIPTLRRLQQQRQITFIKVGGCVRFHKDDIASYVAKRRLKSID